VGHVLLLLHAPVGGTDGRQGVPTGASMRVTPATPVIIKSKLPTSKDSAINLCHRPASRTLPARPASRQLIIKPLKVETNRIANAVNSRVAIFPKNKNI